MRADRHSAEGRTALGVPLSHIGAAMADGRVPPEVLRQVDAELAAEVERLNKARADIATILRDGAPADTPAGFESVAPRLSVGGLPAALHDASAARSPGLP
ncbi:hypothetical protein Ade02nite_90110 [Paractinoplanes deccanensis]|uniref:Uncharacterized protein n=1 Tax=Paractinoplanes deccanensis TaxID=113561 RepID=A0ABQ3YKQ3_9ACTN|nr:hypothetical protein Ade02nite_90110 [Actinoplanes deccanensis]